jgi:hypothetical protein
MSSEQILEEDVYELSMKQQISSMSQSKRQVKMGSTISWGISNIVVCEHSGKPQVLDYDIRLLIIWGGVANLWSRGTIFRDQYSLREYFLLHFLMLGIWIGVVMVAFEDKREMSTASIEGLAWYLNFTMTLVLGLYLALTLERWWTLRVCAIGCLCDCALDITQQVAAYLPNEPQVTACVKRWSLASVHLLQNAARGQEDLEEMVESGRLEATEAHGLKGLALYGRPMVMWAWIARISNEAMLRCNGPEPYSNHLFVMLDVCVKARRAIQTIHTYLLTPLPFAYIHAVALLVDAMVAVTTIKCSLVTTKAMYQENVNAQNIMYEILAFVTLPLLYHGLLSVSVVIRDPFGDDMADFPMSTFERWERANLDAAVFGNDKFPYGEWEVLSGQPQSEASKMAAAAAAFAAAKPQGAETEEDIDEDSAGVQQVADQTALAIMKEATIEVTLSTKRALKGFALELALLQEAVERSEEIRAKETETLLEKLMTS